MRIVAALFALSLAACAPPITKQEFIAAYMPVPTRIDYFDAAYDLSYDPRVQDFGLRAVNARVNAMPYVPERGNHSLDPEIFWREGGDCDKYALIKMLELRAQGVSDLYYLVLVNGPDNDAHAVLVAEDNGTMVALDNRIGSLVPVSALYKTYDPAYFVDVRTGQVWQARNYGA